MCVAKCHNTIEIQRVKKRGAAIQARTGQLEYHLGLCGNALSKEKTTKACMMLFKCTAFISHSLDKEHIFSTLQPDCWSNTVCLDERSVEMNMFMTEFENQSFD